MFDNEYLRALTCEPRAISDQREKSKKLPSPKCVIVCFFYHQPKAFNLDLPKKKKMISIHYPHCH